MVDLAKAAAAIQEELELSPMDMSIRAYYAEDFLVLCWTMELRDRLVRRGRAGTPRFDLILRPWRRQAHATGISMPYLIHLALRGVLANTWTRRTAETLLHGLGVVVKVAASMVSRNDMAGLKVWLHTDDPAHIPSRRILVVEEPRSRGEPSACAVGEVDALWYLITIVQEAGAVQVLAPVDDVPPPPPSDQNEHEVDRDSLSRRRQDARPRGGPAAPEPRSPGRRLQRRRGGAEFK